jgi:hypothetical protein
MLRILLVLRHPAWWETRKSILIVIFTGHSAEFVRHLVEVQVCFETSALTALRNLVIFGVLWILPWSSTLSAARGLFVTFFFLLLRTSLCVG